VGILLKEREMPTPGELLFQRLKGDSSGTDEDIAKESAEYLKNQSGMDRITIKVTVGDTTVTIPGQ
jgi:hypothetical protein